jgi:ubiquinone/menaquinone biosynthesis C-methylase UbiE
MVPETAQSKSRTDAHYLLGRTEHEYQRLMAQAKWIRGLTERTFLEAGIHDGMRVLDIGCGVGDVSMLTAKLVGDSGSVVGIDQDPGALLVAAKRAASEGANQITFVQGDFRKHQFNELFDAAVGRYVLMYQADPVAALKSIMARVKESGLVVLLELDMSRIPVSSPKLPLFEQCFRWGRLANRKAKVNMRMGLDLYKSFQAAGLTQALVRMDTMIGAGRDFPGVDIMADSIRSILPHLESNGIASAEEVGIETLRERLKEELAFSRGVITWSPIVSVWATRSSAPSRGE